MAGDPDLADLIRDAIEDRLLDVHTSIPGLVKAYDFATQTCDVLIGVKRAGTNADGELVFTELPIVPHVPVAWPGGGGFAAMFPLEIGDSVWLVFSEAATGPHRETGEVSVPGFVGRFSLGSAVAVPCPAVVTAKAFADAGGSGEAVIIAPSGGTLRVSKSGGTADFVALASKVTAELTAIASAFATFVPGSGGASFPDVYTGPGDIASATLKAD